jgi:hypothetical protein
MIQAGLGLWILGYIGFAAFFAFIGESRVLCRHCPYYAKEGKYNHCQTHYGFYKLWKYSPKPASLSEKILWTMGMFIMLGYPFPFLILGNQYLILLISLSGLIIWFLIEIKYSKKCVNFSCPLNRVPKDIKDEFLKRHPLMRKAYIENGYELD